MKIVGYTIIIVLLMLEIIFYYYNKNETFKNEQIEKKHKEKKKTKLVNEKFTSFKNEEIEEYNEDIRPWNKVVKVDDEYSKYFIKINNFNENKFLEWKELIKYLDYDVMTKNIIYKTKYEAEALAVINLIISNMNNDIEINDILNNNLLEISIRKAMSLKLVCTKLRDLIESSNKSKNNSDSFDYDIDTFDINEKSDMLNNYNKNLFDNKPIPKIDNNIQPYMGKEYSLF